MMKDSRVKVFLPGMNHSFVERDADLDWCFDPVSVTLLVHPAILVICVFETLSTQLGIDTSPIIACDIFWTEGGVSNYLKETLEA